jgi:RNA polymerase sigma-70 factor (sigma-E family)
VADQRGWDDERFVTFVTERSSALLSYAHRLTGQPHDAEDLLQDVLIRCAAAWPRILQQDDPEGYVRRALARGAINRWRRGWRELPRAEPGHGSVDDDLAQSEPVWAAVKALPPRQRAVVVLRYYEGLSEAEIAAVLRIRPGTVKSQASRALSTLRGALSAERIEVR